MQGSFQFAAALVILCPCMGYLDIDWHTRFGPDTKPLLPKADPSPMIGGYYDQPQPFLDLFGPTWADVKKNAETPYPLLVRRRRDLYQQELMVQYSVKMHLNILKVHGNGSVLLEILGGKQPEFQGKK